MKNEQVAYKKSFTALYVKKSAMPFQFLTAPREYLNMFTTVADPEIRETYVGNLGFLYEKEFLFLTVTDPKSVFHTVASGVSIQWKRSKFKMQFKMNQTDIDRIIEMAWEDRTPFEAIKKQFGLSEGAVIILMRKELKQKSFKRWRERVNSGVSQKHLHKRNPKISRFKSSLQKTITLNKISKR